MSPSAVPPLQAADLPVRYNAVEILERNLASRADRVALLGPDRQMSFGEVAREVNQVGHALRRLGVRRGEPVALLSLDSPEWVASFFGVVKIGAVAVSMNTLLKPREHAYMLNDARPRVLIVHASLIPGLETVRDEVASIEHVVVIGGAGRSGDIAWAQWIAGAPTELAAEPTHREDICSLNYSSGTTGEPKGIPHAHKDYPLTARNVGESVFGLRETDRTFAAAKLFFTFGTGGNLIFPWSVGASVVLFPGPSRVATNILETVDRFRPTFLFHAPTGYAAMLAVAGFTTRYDLSSLRLCVSAGESLPAPIWHAWKEATGLDILDGIGSTENFHMFISSRPGEIRPGSTGLPVPGYSARLMDEQGGEVLPGMVGNLLVRGETAALSYLHKYAASQKTFLGEWLSTGDKYVRDEDGYYWHAGRSDDMLKVGGLWVSPLEVESALLCHRKVLECAVVGHEDEARLVKPRAFVVLKDGEAGSEELSQELIAFCRERMAEYKRPRWVVFLPELPKTATGKIQRFKLRQT
ncbi:MAG TPA: benzoate-CoA ligase family protein [Vicinamibacteria bacterium]